jgi:hypothetical protein
VQITGDRIDRTDRVSLSAGIDERGARRALRAQIAKLERELSGIVAEGFPHIAPPGLPDLASPHIAPRAYAGAGRRGHRTDGAPCLLDLGRLERTRDELAGDVQAARRATVQRAELQTRARELLEAMWREPARYKFVRLPVRDLGEGGCGVWEVRPRLGLLGMLAGWWQVKLSSGCPLARGHAARRDPEIIQCPESELSSHLTRPVPQEIRRDRTWRVDTNQRLRTPVAKRRSSNPGHSGGRAASTAFRHAPAASHPPARTRTAAQTVAHGPRTDMSASRRSRRE